MSSNDYIVQSFSLKGKTAIVTGGTGGLGSAMAGALARAGAWIVSIELPDDPMSSKFQEKIENLGSKVQIFRCNLSDTGNLRACYKSIWDAGIVPDILLNCAGVMRRNLCEDTTDAELDLLFEVNAKACYISTQEFGRRLLSLGLPGKVINVASVTCYQAGFRTSVYAATKGAVMQMTKAFSNEWVSKGIQVNAIAPGFMKTAMTAQYQDDQKMTDYLMSRVPAARWGEPEDLEPAVLFLSAPANKFVSGHVLAVDGGFMGK